MAKKKATVKIAQTLSLTPEQVKSALEAKKGGAENVFYADKAPSPKAPASPFLAQEDEMGQIGNTVKAAQKMLGSTENGHIAFTANLGKPDNDEEMQTYRDQNSAIIKRNELAGDVYQMKRQETDNQNQLIGKLNKYLSGESAFSDMSHQGLRANNPYDPGGLRYTGEYAPVKAPDVPTLEKLEKMPAPIYNKVQVQVAKKPVVARGAGAKPEKLMLAVRKTDGSIADVEAKNANLYNDAWDNLEKEGVKGFTRNTIGANDHRLANENPQNVANAGRALFDMVAQGIAAGDPDLNGWAYSSPDGRKVSAKEAMQQGNGGFTLKPGYGVMIDKNQLFKSADGTPLVSLNGDDLKDRISGFQSAQAGLGNFLRTKVYTGSNPTGAQIYQFGFKQGVPLESAVQHSTNVILGAASGVLDPAQSRFLGTAKRK